MYTNLRIEVKDNVTDITYIDNGMKMFEFTSPSGDIEISKNKFSESVANNWFSYIIWCLHSISYIDRIPTEMRVLCKDNAVWFSSIINRHSYAQFYTNSQKVHVIIETLDNNYERRQKTISKFKI